MDNAQSSSFAIPMQEEAQVKCSTTSSHVNSDSSCSGTSIYPDSFKTASSTTFDFDVFAGRMGKEETCIVNAAIMYSSWSHSKSSGKRYNKPIVVDVDLPTC